MRTEVLRTGFQVNGNRIDFLSGEFHYWRVKKENWDPILDRLIAMGLKVISTYVPWNFHATLGSYDFRGETDPQRDLAGFIDLVKRRNLWMMIRPGPYIYAEWKYGGVPKEAYQLHRFDDRFKSLASKYIAAVCNDCVVRNLSTRGGPIFVLQADNEIDPWVRSYREELGLSKAWGPFKDFLTDEYKTVVELNKAWGSEYRSFEDVRPFEEHPLKTALPGEKGIFTRYLDYRSFLDWAIERILSWVVDEYRRNGVDVPIITNTYDDFVFHDLTKLSRIVDLPCMDIYLSKHLPDEEFLKLSYWVRVYSAYSKFPIATEFQSGIWIDSLYSTGPIDGRHEKLLGLAAMAWGLKGWNWYMAVGRDNWTCAPINEWGLINPDVYDALTRLSSFYEKIRPYELIRLTGLALSHYRPQLLLGLPSELLSQDWGTCFKSLHKAGLDFTLYNPEIDAERRPFVLYAGNEMMRRKDAVNLLRSCQGGSHVVFFRTFPSKDFSGEELDEFNFMPRPIGTRGEPRGRQMLVELSFRNSVTTSLIDGFRFYDGEWGEKISLNGISKTSAYADSEPVIGEHVVGFSKEIGSGRATIVGLEPTPDVIRFLVRGFSISLPGRALTPDTHIALHHDAKDNSRYVVFMINSSSRPQLASMKLYLPSGRYRFAAIQSKDEGVIEGDGEFHQYIDWKDGEIIELTQIQ